MQDTPARTRPVRAAIAAMLVLATLIGGVIWYRHAQAAAQRQACTDAYAYTMWLDRQGYTGPVQDPTFVKNRDRCLG